MGGTYRRLDLIAAALGNVAELEVLLFSPPDVDRGAAALARRGRRLEKRWGCPVRLHQVPSAPLPDDFRRSNWRFYGAPALSAGHQQSLFPTSRPAQARAFDRVCRATRPDLLFVHRLPAMGPVLAHRRRDPPALFDLDDLEHVRLWRSLRQGPHWRGQRLLALQLPALLLVQWRAIRRSARTFVCSPRDRDSLGRWVGRRRLAVLPNGAEAPAATRFCREPVLLFLGQLTYPPNRLAAEYLRHRVFPRVRAAVPGARLVVAGAGREELDFGADPEAGVEVPGFVADLGALYDRVRVVCTPIFSGSGTRVKIVEAAGRGKAIVSTRLGAEGLAFRDPEEIRLRDDPSGLAAACIELLCDDGAARTLGRAARERFDRFYRAERVREEVVRQVHEVLAERADAGGDRWSRLIRVS